MMRKRIVFVLILALLLTACGTKPDRPASSGGPVRMVRRIEVAVSPENPDFTRTYVTQENMNALLTLLRSMENDSVPETEPDPNGGQILYTATVTFANGQQSVYSILGHTYLRLGDNPWCVISVEQSLRFTDFIRQHPSDDGSAPIETTAPAESGASAESSEPTE